MEKTVDEALKQDTEKLKKVHMDIFNLQEKINPLIVLRSKLRVLVEEKQREIFIRDKGITICKSKLEKGVKKKDSIEDIVGKVSKMTQDEKRQFLIMLEKRNL